MRIHKLWFVLVSVAGLLWTPSAKAQNVIFKDSFPYTTLGDFKANWTFNVGGGIYVQGSQMNVHLANTLVGRDFSPTILPHQAWTLSCSVAQNSYQRSQWFGLFTADLCHGYLAQWNSSVATVNNGCGIFALYKYDSSVPINAWNVTLPAPLISKASLYSVLAGVAAPLQLSAQWDSVTNLRNVSLVVANGLNAPTTLQMEVPDTTTKPYTRVLLSGNSSGIFSALTLSSTVQVFNVLNYGATGNGVSDDTAALNRAITAAQSVNGGVYLPATAQSYNYSSCLTLTGISFWGDGPGSLLRATNPMASALILQGDRPSLSNVKIISPNSNQVGRQVSPQTGGVMINGATNFSVQGVTIDTTASVGIIAIGSAGQAGSPSPISGCLVANTLADGIHLTEQSAYINVTSNTVTNSGDDMYAVVSYTRDVGMCHDILISGNRGNGQSADGRGISVVGGQGVTIQNNVIQNTRGAGIYLQSELLRNPDGSLLYKTFGDDHIIVQGNTLNTLGLTVYHGAINLGGRPADTIDLGQTETGPQLITNVSILNNTITNSQHSGASLQSYFNNVSLEGNTFTGSVGNGIEVFGGSNVYIGEQSANTVSQSGNFGLFIGTNSTLPLYTTGAVVVQNNTFQNSNTLAIVPLPAVYLSQRTPGTVVSGNTVTNPGNYLLGNPAIQY